VRGNRVYLATLVSNAGGLVVIGDPMQAGCATNHFSGLLTVTNSINGVEVIGHKVALALDRGV
jgi:hypothetical protein